MAKSAARTGFGAGAGAGAAMASGSIARSSEVIAEDMMLCCEVGDPASICRGAGNGLYRIDLIERSP